MALEEIASILNQICLRAIRRDPPDLKVYETLPELLDSNFFSHDEISKLREIAREKNYLEVQQLFLNIPPTKIETAESDSCEDPWLKDLTLGHRRSLAKTQNRNILRRLLREQEPRIIRLLLMNPRVTESDVLRIASLRPTSPRVLEEVFRSSKWIARYRVKKALVYNPFCPPDIALHLLKFMLMRDLDQISKDENLPLFLQDSARLLQEAKETFMPSDSEEPRHLLEPS